MIKATLVAVAVVTSATACHGGVPHDAKPTDRSIAPVATTESASPCSSATADVLKSAALSQFFGNHPEYSTTLTVTKVLCSGDWAKTLIDIPHDPNTNPPGIVLYHHDGGNGWRAVQYGSGFDCTNEGVPPSIAGELEC